MSCSLFTYTDPAPTEIYTLSLHDALPILRECCHMGQLLLEFLLRRDAQRDPAGIRLVQKAERLGRDRIAELGGCCNRFGLDRKSTRLNSSHRCISYAVFCLKKKNIPQLSF